MRLNFFKQHHRGTYGSLRSQVKLNEHLREIDVQASELLGSTLSDLIKKNGTNEQLKAADPMRWIQEMNNLKACAETIVLREIVYQGDLFSNRTSDKGI